MTRRPSRSMTRWLMVLCAITTILQVYTAWNWGLPARESWAVDSVGGMRIVEWVRGGMRYDPGFEGRYTPVHKYVLAAAYAPVVGTFWIKNDFGSGEWSTEHTLAYHTALWRTGRMVTIAMAVGMLLTLFALGRWLGNEEAGLIAAACWIGTYPALYLSQTTNLDVPYLFWTLLSLERLLAYHGTRIRRWLILSAIFGGLAVGSKESAVGLICVFPFLLLWSPLRGEHGGVKVGLGGAIRIGLLWGLVALLTYAMTCQVFFRPSNYLDHLRTIAGIAEELQVGQKKVLLWFLQNLGKSAHPLVLCVFALGLTGAMLRRGRLWLWLLAPVLSYHLVFIMKTEIVGARYILPHLTFLALLGGVGLAEVLSPWPALRRRLAPGIAGACFVSGLAMPMVLWTDSRQLAQDWLSEHDDVQNALGTYCQIPAYLPPLAQEKARMGKIVDRRPGPVDGEYLICVSTFYERFLWFEEPDAAHGWNALLAGKLAFEPVARFDPWSPPPPWVDITKCRPTMPGFAQTIHILRRKPTVGESERPYDVPRLTGLARDSSD